METCIQRYRARRKWDPARHAIFSRFLVLGGVRSGQKSYGGGLNLEGRVSEDEEGPDAEEIAMQTATDYVCSFEISNRNSNDWKGTPGVFDDEEEKEEWWVDFEHVVKGFLSYVIPHIMCYHTEADLLLGVSIVRNFLNYVYIS